MAGVKTNGCSGGIDTAYRAVYRKPPPFGYCCNEHDLFYYQGGGRATRAFADERFRQCLQGHIGWLAWVLWMAVRVCGVLYWDRRRAKRAAFWRGVKRCCRHRAGL